MTSPTRANLRGAIGTLPRVDSGSGGSGDEGGDGGGSGGGSGSGGAADGVIVGAGDGVVIVRGRGRIPRAPASAPISEGSSTGGNDISGDGNVGALPESDEDTSPVLAHVPGYSSLQSLFENRRSIVLRGIRDR